MKIQRRKERERGQRQIQRKESGKTKRILLAEVRGNGMIDLAQQGVNNDSECTSGHLALNHPVFQY